LLDTYLPKQEEKAPVRFFGSFPNLTRLDGERRCKAVEGTFSLSIQQNEMERGGRGPDFGRLFALQDPIVTGLKTTTKGKKKKSYSAIKGPKTSVFPGRHPVTRFEEAMAEKRKNGCGASSTTRWEKKMPTSVPPSPCQTRPNLKGEGGEERICLGLTIEDG